MSQLTLYNAVNTHFNCAYRVIVLQSKTNFNEQNNEMMNKQTLKKELRRSFETFIRELEQTERINYKPAPDKWSAGEIASHLIKGSVPDFGVHFATPDRAADHYEEEIRGVFLNDTVKMSSPPPLVPENRDFSQEELVEQLQGNLEGLEQLIDASDLSEVCKDIPFPGWGYLTRHELIVLITAHFERHKAQLQTISNSIS